MTIMKPRHAHFTGAFVAVCPKCDFVCAYWDEDDLDEDGNLHCDRCAEDEDGR